MLDVLREKVADSPSSLPELHSCTPMCGESTPGLLTFSILAFVSGRSFVFGGNLLFFSF
jgi:hypothetical protein